MTLLSAAITDNPPVTIAMLVIGLSIGIFAILRGRNK
jgi:F0F1-type ATP synthase assembly protein I